MKFKIGTKEFPYRGGVITLESIQLQLKINGTFHNIGCSDRSVILERGSEFEFKYMLQNPEYHSSGTTIHINEPVFVSVEEE